MLTIQQALEKGQNALEAAQVHPILDPTLLDALTDEQLEALHEIIRCLRDALKAHSEREREPAEAYGAQNLLSLTLLYRGRGSGRYNEAFDAATVAITIDPFKGEAYRNRGHIELLRGLKRPLWMARAQIDFERALRYGADDVVSRYGRALSQELPALKKLEAVARLREKGKEQQAYELISEAEEEIDNAIDDWNELIQSHPHHGLAMLHRARCLSSLGEIDRALVDLDCLCRLGIPALSWSRSCAAKMLAEAHRERAHLASAQRRFPDALEDLHEAMKLEPECVDFAVFRERAAISFKARAFDMVVEDCTRILEEEDDTDTLLLRARAYYQLSRLNLSKADASRLLQRDEGHRAARLLRGRCAMALGAIQSALADFEKCLHMWHRSGESLDFKGEALLSLGCAYHKIGKEEEAQSALLQAHEAGNSRATEKLTSWFEIE